MGKWLNCYRKLSGIIRDLDNDRILPCHITRWANFVCNNIDLLIFAYNRFCLRKSPRNFDSLTMSENSISIDGMDVRGGDVAIVNTSPNSSIYTNNQEEVENASPTNALPDSSKNIILKQHEDEDCGLNLFEDSVGDILSQLQDEKVSPANILLDSSSNINKQQGAEKVSPSNALPDSSINIILKQEDNEYAGLINLYPDSSRDIACKLQDEEVHSSNILVDSSKDMNKKQDDEVWPGKSLPDSSIDVIPKHEDDEICLINLYPDSSRDIVFKMLEEEVSPTVILRDSSKHINKEDEVFPGNSLPDSSRELTFKQEDENFGIVNLYPDSATDIPSKLRDEEVNHTISLDSSKDINKQREYEDVSLGNSLPDSSKDVVLNQEEDLGIISLYPDSATDILGELSSRDVIPKQEEEDFDLANLFSDSAGDSKNICNQKDEVNPSPDSSSGIINEQQDQDVSCPKLLVDSNEGTTSKQKDEEVGISTSLPGSSMEDNIRKQKEDEADAFCNALPISTRNLIIKRKLRASKKISKKRFRADETDPVNILYRRKKSFKIEDPMRKAFVHPNYFVAFQVDRYEIQENMYYVQQKLIEEDHTLSKCMVNLHTTHVTLMSVYLKDSEAHARALEALRTVVEIVNEEYNRNPLRITFKGLGNFENKVVYVKIRNDDERERLISLAELVQDHLVEFESEEMFGKYIPHLTLLKLSKAGRGRKPFDRISTQVYEPYNKISFGVQVVRSIQLLSMFDKKRRDGYYSGNELFFEDLVGFDL